MEKFEIDCFVYCMPRCGTTLFNNILNKVFCGKDGDKVASSPDPIEGYSKGIAIIRDFRDVAVSHWRIWRGKYDESGKLINKIEKYEIKDFCRTVYKKIEDFEKFKKMYPEHIIIKYEDFYNHPENIIKIVAEYFDINIEQSVLDKIKDEYDFNKDKEISNSMGSFNDYDKESLIHGNHIYTGKPGTWKEIVPKEHWKHFNDLLNKDLEKYGYKR